MQRNRFDHFLITLAALAAAWGILTLFDLGQRATAGYAADANHAVTRVDAAGAAARAGLRAGDIIRSIDGIATGDVAGLAGLERPEIGETRRFGIERDGRQAELSVTYARLGARDRRVALARILVGFCFLGCCLAAFLAKRARATRILAVMGVGIGLAFLPGPYFEAAGLRAVAAVLRSAVVLAGAAALLHFLLVFPRPGRFIERPRGRALLYAPVLLFWLLIAYRVLFAPAATGTLNTLTSLFAGLIVGGYGLLGISTLLRSYIRATTGERRAHGLHGMLWGTLLGLAPPVAGAVVSAGAPGTELPGGDFLFLALALIPLTWSLAARRPAASPQ